jgi:pilus assembly protein CpaB
MNVSRLAILGVALVAGVGAFFIMMSNRSDPEPVRIVQQVKEESVRVLVSTRDFQRGERLSVDETTWIAWPKKGIQPTFITDETPDAREKLQEAVARSLIVTGEPIVQAKVVYAGSSGLMAAMLSPGMRAVTLRVSPETSSGGFILPGDEVDLLHTEGTSTRLVFEKVRVLAVNSFYYENSETPHLEGSNMTLEMSPEEAETFLTKRSRGSFSVVLRSIFKPEGEVAQAERKRTNINIIRYGRS